MKKIISILFALLISITPICAQRNPDLRHLPKRPIERTEMVLPKIKGYNVYKADFHIHTTYSDGDVSVKGRVSEAFYDGLEIIAITDHIEYRPYEARMLQATRGYHKELPKAKNNRLMNEPADKDGILADLNTPYEDAKKYGKRMGLLVIPGVEITRHPDKIGHYNALFIKDANTIYDPNPEQSLRNAKSQGALIIHNHPGGARKSVDMNSFHHKIYDAGLIDGVEVVNNGGLGVKLIKRCLDRKLFMVGATDIHTLSSTLYSQRGYFRTCTLVLAKELTEKSIRNALEKGRTLAYSYDHVIGEESLIEELFHNSVSLKVAYTNPKGVKTVILTNTSSIPYQISFSGKGEGSTLSPFQSRSFNVAKDKDFTFSVMNLWTADDEHPQGKHLQVCYKAKDLK